MRIVLEMATDEQGEPVMKITGDVPVALCIEGPGYTASYPAAYEQVLSRNEVTASRIELYLKEL